MSKEDELFGEHEDITGDSEITIETVCRMTLELDELDAKTVNQAIAMRQAYRFPGTDICLLPKGGGNMAGRIIAEICRGWMELRKRPPPTA